MELTYETEEITIKKFREFIKENFEQEIVIIYK